MLNIITHSSLITHHSYLLLTTHDSRQKSYVMTCYLAKIIYQIVCGDGNHTPQFDEQLRLITACNYADAFNKATAVGYHEEHNFYNHYHKLVQWKFINVSELYCMTDYADGAEMYSCIKEIPDPKFYINEVHLKAKRLQQEDFHFLMHASS